ncbi:mevalonyl-coenzyme A hydratase sidH [Glossina fuscipes]|uniref:Mevalonyl-coenzyme A hydratase sidH n=1 Tax=Glossina fuscipes TaxID=7396 RepID=A0A9C5Z838_9MUSC|nr:mevalonyl-coenzyme A hydratase sidH [Glossina fuscipes]KAI9579166.1 hypothetical protein GQX74_014783 [Glossina fuscipes]
MFRQLSRCVNKIVDANVLQLNRGICSARCLLKKEAVAEMIEEKPIKPNTVLVEKDKNITLIGINRPRQRNAIDGQTAAKLCEAFSAFEADDASPVAVLYGIGGSFCSGFDILEMANEDESTVSVEILMMPEGSVGPTRRQLSKPVVCGINGYCVANGLELALMCDLRVMEESAVLGFFNRRFGVPVIDGGTARLPAMIGLSRALDLILTGRHVCAEEAHSMGIANRIVGTGEALNKAVELAKCLSKFPQSALNHDRKSVYSAVFDVSSFQQAIQNEIMYTSKDIIDQMHDGIKWFNKTFKDKDTDSWLKRDKSMADWYDEEVAEAAAKVEEEKQAKEALRIEAQQKAQEERERKFKEKTIKSTKVTEKQKTEKEMEKNAAAPESKEKGDRNVNSTESKSKVNYEEPKSQTSKEPKK